MQNVKYTEYDLETGAILRVAQCSSSRKLPPPIEGEGRIFEASDPKEDMVVDGEIQPRNQFEVQADRTGNDIRLSNVPANTIVSVEVEQFTMDDSGLLELTVDQPIAVTFTLSHKLYKTMEFTVEA